MKIIMYIMYINKQLRKGCNHIRINIFSPSLLNQLLWKHLMEPSIPPTHSSCFIFSRCIFARQGRSLILTSFESIPFRSLLELEIESVSFFESARASVVVHGRAFFHFFVSKFVFASLVKVVRSAKESWRRDSIPRPPRLFTKSWQIITSSHRGLTLY